MRHLWGLSDPAWQQGKLEPVVMDTDSLINGHMLIAGMSGTGKSYQITQLLNACARESIEVDVFDVHEELHESRNSSSAKFSAATRLGYNPLAVDVDPHAGGPINQIGFLIDMLNRTSSRLGPRQERAIYSLASDLYWMRGIDPENPRSWAKRHVTEQQWRQMKESRQWDAMKGCYPTLGDLIDLGERKLKQLTMGIENRCLSALDKVMSTASKIQSIKTRYNKASSDKDVETLQAQLDKEKETAIDAYVDFVRNIELGREYQDASKFSNVETLQSVLDRIKSLYTVGIFCSNPPDWGASPIRVYQIGSLRDDERRLLFYNRSTQILRECMNAGKQATLKRIILVDEGHLYYSEDGDNPLNRIAKEGRKFGLGLVVGSQSPTHFSEDFLTNCGTVALLGIHENYWDMAIRKMRIDRQALLATRPREVMALKMQIAGAASARVQLVNVNKQAVLSGIAEIKRSKQPAPPTSDASNTINAGNAVRPAQVNQIGSLAHHPIQPNQAAPGQPAPSNLAPQASARPPGANQGAAQGGAPGQGFAPSFAPTGPRPNLAAPIRQASPGLPTRPQAQPPAAAKSDLR